MGWNADGDLRVLEHAIIWGSPLENATWQDLDAWLSRQFLHPNGAPLYISAAIVDSGNWADQVYAFTRPRTSRRIVAGKGIPGFSRPTLAWGKSRSTRLAQIGVDAVKLHLHERIKDGRTVRFAGHLGPDYFDQVNAERLVVRYTHGHPVKTWHLASGRRNEALDCLVYATAARHLAPAALPPERLVEAAIGQARPATAFRSKWIGA